MKYATFLNYTNEDITVHWNGKPYTVKAGQKREHIQAGIAQVFAKVLANRELIKAGKENATSPKKPLEVPEFMAEFNKAYFLENNGMESDPETGLAPDINSASQPGMNVNVIPRTAVDPYDSHANVVLGPSDKPQIIGEATADEESAFEDPKN